MWVFLFLRKKRKLAVRSNLTFNGDSIEWRLPVYSSILPRQRITYEKSLGCAYFITTASLYSCWSLKYCSSGLFPLWHFASWSAVSIVYGSKGGMSIYTIKCWVFVFINLTGVLGCSYGCRGQKSCPTVHMITSACGAQVTRRSFNKKSHLLSHFI